MRAHAAFVALVLLALEARAIESSTYLPPAGMRRCALTLEVDSFADHHDCNTGTAQDRIDCVVGPMVAAYTLLDKALNDLPVPSFPERYCAPIIAIPMGDAAVPGAAEVTRWWGNKPLLDVLRARIPGVRIQFASRGDVRVYHRGDPTASPPAPDFIATSGGGALGCEPGSISHDSGKGGLACTLGRARMCAGGGPGVATMPCNDDDQCPSSTCEAVDFDPEWIVRVPAAAMQDANNAFASFTLGGRVHRATFCGTGITYTNQDCLHSEDDGALATLEPFVTEGTVPIPYSSDAADLSTESGPTTYSASGFAMDIRSEAYQDWLVAGIFEHAYSLGYGMDGDAGRGAVLVLWSKYARLPYYEEGADLVTDPPNCGGHPTIKRWWLPAHLYAGELWRNFRLEAMCGTGGFDTSHAYCTTPEYPWRDGLPDCPAPGAAGGHLVDYDAGGPWEVEHAVAASYRKLLAAIERPGSPLPDAQVYPVESTEWRQVPYASCGFMPDVCRHPRVFAVQRRSGILSLWHAIDKISPRRKPLPNYELP